MSETKHRLWKPVSVFFGSIALCGMVLVGARSPLTSASTSTKEIPSARDSKMLEVGEELDYKVSYSFFTIGTIRTKVISKEERNGLSVYKCRAFIDSNPSLSWLVDLHIQFYTEMDGSVYSHNWVMEDSSKKEINFKRLRFDYENKRAFLEVGKKLSTEERKPDSIDTVTVVDHCQDGLSLFYYAREHVREQSQVHVPTLIERKQESTYINFMGKHTEAEADGVEYPVDVVEFDGKADYVGIFGLTGGFRGWFSNDDARVPILARMNVILGSIKIQLMRWNRPGWLPPKYVEATEK